MRQTLGQAQEVATLVERIMLTVEDVPGLNIQELADHVEASRSSVRHHISRLASDQLVTVQRQGNHRLHFTTAMPQARRRAIALLRLGSLRSIVDSVMRPRPGSKGGDILFCVPDVAGETGLSLSSVYRSLKALDRAGLARTARAGARGAYSFSPHPELRIAWTLYCKDAARMPRPLRSAPVWMLGIELLLGKMALGGWAAS